MDAHTQLELWHLLLGALITGITVIGAVWRTWVVPGHEKDLKRAKWEAGMEARMASGEKAFAAAKERDDLIIKRLDGIEERLRHIEVKLGGEQG